MDLSPSDWEFLKERADSFVGREWVFTRVRSFLSGPPGIFLLRGDPGTGKTAIAARLAQASFGRIAANDLPVESPVAEATISAAVFCRADRVIAVLELVQRLSDQLVASVEGFADELQSTLAHEISVGDVHVETGDVSPGANVAGVRIMLNLNGLSDERAFSGGVAAPLRQLRERGAARPIVLLVDAVDEAAATGEVNTFSRLLAKLDGVHLIVTCRPDARVLADFRAAEHQMDLAKDAPPHDDDVHVYIRNRLRGRSREGTIRALVDRIASEAHGNFLYAFYVTGTLVQSDSLAEMDENAIRGLPLPTGGLPGVYEDFLDRQIAGDETRWVADFRPLLAPLCVAFGDGFTTVQLGAIATRLTGRDFSLSKARDVTRMAGQFLDGPRPDGPFRAYHHSFIRFLTDPEKNPNWPIDLTGINKTVLEVLRAEGADHGWPASSVYARNYAPSHAADAGLLERFFHEADFLVGMAPAGMRSVIRSLAAGAREDDPVSIYEAALPFLCDEPGINATVLELVSWIQGNQGLSQELADVRVKRPYMVAGNIRPFDRALARFDRHTAVVRGVAALGWPGLDHRVIVTTSYDATARVWDPRDPGQELARFDRHTGQVHGVAALGWPGLDHPVIVTTSSDGTARVWDPRDPGQELARFDRHTAGVRGVAALSWPGLDHPVIVTTSLDGTARVWDPRDPSQELARFDRHTGELGGVAALGWPGLDHPVIVTTSDDRTARVWDPRDPGRELARFNGHTSRVWGVAALGWPGLDHPVIVTTSLDGTAQVWDPRDPSRELARFDGHTGEMQGVTALAWPGLDHPVIVTASLDGTARVWDPRDPSQELARFNGHTGGVVAVAALAWPDLDHPVVVTTSWDTTTRVWDPRRPGRELARSDGHTGEVVGMAALAWPGLDHPVVVTTSLDGTARVWDPRDPSRELARFNGHTGWVWGVAALAWPGLDHPVIVTTSSDGTARVWDPRDPGRELARFNGHTSKVVGVAVLAWPGLDHPVIVTTSFNATALVWDPRDPGRELARFNGHTGVVGQVATLAWPGLDHPVIVTTSSDGTARVWDPRDPGRELARYDGHTDQVTGVAVLAWPGLDHPVIVTTSGDGTARVWDPRDPGRELARYHGHTGVVGGAAVLAWPGLDHPVIVTTSFDGTARVWDPRQPHSELAYLSLLGQGHGVAVLDQTTLAIASSRGFLVFELKTDENLHGQ